MAKLKVFGTDHASVIGSGFRQCHSIVAASSMKEAARLLGVSRYVMSNYASPTENEEECLLALSEPGQVFFRSIDWPKHGREWRRASIPDGKYALYPERVRCGHRDPAFPNPCPLDRGHASEHWYDPDGPEVDDDADTYPEGFR